MADVESSPVVQKMVPPPLAKKSSNWTPPYLPKKYNRRGHALSLRKSRSLYGCSFEKKASISSCGVDFWDEEFCGIPRVAVHGDDAICVVMRNQDLLHLIHQEEEAKQHMSDLRKSAILPNFNNAIIYEVEDKSTPFDESCKTFSKSFQKPFSVVSVPSTEMGHKVSSHEVSSADYDADKAIKFLQEEMKSKAAFTFLETVQTAILGLHHLFGKNFKADEIRAFVLKCGGPTRYGYWKSIEKVPPPPRDTAYELAVFAERSIEDYLAVIDNACAEGSGS